MSLLAIYSYQFDMMLPYMGKTALGWAGSMAGRRVEIAWEEQDTPEALRERYRKQEGGEVRSRLQALWLLRTGWGLASA